MDFVENTTAYDAVAVDTPLVQVWGHRTSNHSNCGFIAAIGQSGTLLELI